MNKFQIHQGHVLDVLKGMADESVHCVVTSPPYWGLRAYGTEPQVWSNGQPLCEGEHSWSKKLSAHHPGQVKDNKAVTVENAIGQNAGAGQFCRDCNAWRGELGLEPTPELFIQHLVEIFREVRRVLKATGTCFINIGDSYWGGKGQSGHGNSEYQAERYASGESINRAVAHVAGQKKTRPQDGKHDTIKPKDLCMIPAQLAIALRNDGWYLRAEIVWAKPNPMPESVTDRPTRSHEMVYLLTKSPDYFYDQHAIREPLKASSIARLGQDVESQEGSSRANGGKKTNGNMKAARFGGANKHVDSPTRLASGNEWQQDIARGANRKSVWIIPTVGFSAAHFATFPPALVEPCIKAGTSEKGCCAACGSPYTRIVEPTEEYKKYLGCDWSNQEQDNAEGRGHFELESGGRASQRPVKRDAPSITASYVTKGWKAGCECETEIVPCTVLDPFAGACTTLLVAARLGRRGIGIELNPDYIRMGQNRVIGDAPLFNRAVAVPFAPPMTQEELIEK